MNDSEINVVKLGGSLLDLPDVLDRFDRYRQTALSRRAALVVGGGAAADIVRDWDRRHDLGEEEGHWLALRAMQLNTHMVARNLKRWRMVTDPPQCHGAWGRGDLAVVDPLEWLKKEHAAGITIPHRWSFTSDSIAAHVVCRLGAARLVLLKSVLPAGDDEPADLAARSIVDADFADASRGIRWIELVNLRVTPPGSLLLRSPAAEP